ncbi:MAG: SAM-dependent methyltransferase, partial [Spirochaetales bacterium]|nr:SAM-dependent methyltransferase [Spirochaetales bacterium]
MDYTLNNRDAWNCEVGNNNYWTRIVDDKSIQDARDGNISITVTPSKPIPYSWIEELKGKKILNLAGGGGQQTPL